MERSEILIRERNAELRGRSPHNQILVWIAWYFFNHTTPEPRPAHIDQ